ncbi:MAG: prolyl oligopeptidase family serine peptidase [Eubacteriales bacterium]|jgi:carboxylesterase|nr:prolyl oligopeptidase family serine peptidase [Eubacteriales bacterium]
MYKTGVLLIHGFAGSRDEVRTLYDKLTESNIYARMVAVKGHEGRPRDLARTTYRDWIESARTEYADMIITCEKVVLAGFSAGGLIAVNLYREHECDKLITINTPVCYWNIRQIFKNIRTDFRKYIPVYFRACTDKRPASLVNFLKLLYTTRRYFGEIECDMLIIQAADDDTSHYRSGKYIYDSVKGTKKLLTPPRGGHGILTGEYREEVISEILTFINADGQPRNA